MIDSREGAGLSAALILSGTVVDTATGSELLTNASKGTVKVNRAMVRGLLSASPTE